MEDSICVPTGILFYSQASVGRQQYFPGLNSVSRETGEMRHARESQPLKHTPLAGHGEDQSKTTDHWFLNLHGMAVKAKDVHTDFICRWWGKFPYNPKDHCHECSGLLLWFISATSSKISNCLHVYLLGWNVTILNVTGEITRSFMQAKWDVDSLTRENLTLGQYLMIFFTQWGEKKKSCYWWD